MPRFGGIFVCYLGQRLVARIPTAASDSYPTTTAVNWDMLAYSENPE
jgi:hypothetical protein